MRYYDVEDLLGAGCIGMLVGMGITIMLLIAVGLHTDSENWTKYEDYIGSLKQDCEEQRGVQHCRWDRETTEFVPKGED